MERKIGLSSLRARAKASAPHSDQCTRFFSCSARYGLFAAYSGSARTMRIPGIRRRSMCDDFRMQLSSKWLDDLARRYSEPHRRYHTLAHVEELLALLRDFELQDRDSVEAAVWFHDAIYDTRATDNEARSAELAATALREMNHQNIDAVRAMI